MNTPLLIFITATGLAAAPLFAADTCCPPSKGGRPGAPSLPSAGPATPAADRAAPPEPPHDEGGHDRGAASRTLDDIFAARCEHDIPTHTCEACRYELGLVKIDPSLVRTEGKPDGLLALGSVKRVKAQTLLLLNGEIALNANTQARVAPRVSGIVRDIRADLGAAVEKGDTLFDIESPELARAAGAYRKYTALAALALKNLERERALAEKQISPQADVVEAQMRYDEYRIELDAAAGELAVMGLDAASIAALAADGSPGRVGTLPVRAPLSGTVIERHLTPGGVVETGAGLLTVADLSTVWVWLSLYERDLARLLDETRKSPVRVRVRTAAFPDAAFEGVIDLVGTQVDEDDRTVKVRATLKNPDGRLRPGMFCTADAVYETADQVLAVPKSALMADEGVSFVFRRIRDGYVLRTDVKPGRVFADSVEILDGIAEGETVVTDGAFVCKSDVLRAKMGAGCAD
jgi:cobalt-zinc-cadmium efflux system membrane fusion protein